MEQELRNLIREQRKKRGFTIRALAKKLNVSPAYIASLEKGYRKNPKKEYLDRVLKFLKLNDHPLTNSQKDSEISGDIYKHGKKLSKEQFIDFLMNQNQELRSLLALREQKIVSDAWLKKNERLHYSIFIIIGIIIGSVITHYLG